MEQIACGTGFKFLKYIEASDEMASIMDVIDLLAGRILLKVPETMDEIR